MLNHVERSASADAMELPDAVVVAGSPRRDELRATVASTAGPEAPSALPSIVAVTGTGPQLWYGEMPSNGSRAEGRYGLPAPPNASAADCVQPPVLEEKNVVATWPA